MSILENLKKVFTTFFKKSISDHNAVNSKIITQKHRCKNFYKIFSALIFRCGDFLKSTNKNFSKVKPCMQSVI